MELNHNEKNELSKFETRVAMDNGNARTLMIPDKQAEAEADEDKVAVDDGRETWGKKIDFLLSIIGFAVDLANVWRFPHLCYKNGGGGFLIPYFTMLIFGALPLFLMELSLGQFHRTGAISVWKISPLFKGIGWSVCLIAYLVAFYYNVIIGWSLFYLYNSFNTVLPWTQCDNAWNTPKCWDGTSRIELLNGTNITSAPQVKFNKTIHISAATEYFERGVLGLHHSDGLHDLGPPRWQLALCLLFVFFILYFSLWKGVKSSGKVVWVTATMPYLVLLILLIRGAMLEGALEGVLYFITPKFDRLLDPKVWIDAAIQIFYSVGAGFGVHIAYASYNKFDNNLYRDCICTAFVNSFTSMFSGFVIFTYLGYMANRQDVNIDEVVAEGPGLVFIVYPEAIATLPGSVGWSIMFFIMLITLGLDSAMGGMESVLTGITDQFRPFFKRWRFSREVFTGLLIMVAFLISMVNITYGGMYVFTILDTFAGGTSLIFAVFAQAVAISWFYGIEQFCKDFETMLGFQPNLYWRICWKFISPAFIFAIVICSLLNYAPLVYKSAEKEYIYPEWANAVGWMIAVVAMSLIPIVAAYQLATTRGSLSKRFALCISPTSEHKAIEKGEPVKRFQRRHWVSF